MHHSLLDDSLFRVQRSDGMSRTCTLPEILHTLATDNVLSFEALQPHQQQAWYSFLVQLAAMAIAREAEGELPTSPDTWRTALVGLADGEEAWHLVVDDLSEPAFMQSPVPEGSLEAANFTADMPTPDQLDMLVTSKNHDVKRNRISHPQIEHWIYALVTLQTMEGFMGRGNRGIARMNGGNGNRPLLGLTSGLTWSERFQRDVDILVSERPQIAEIHDYDLSGEIFLWLVQWSGKKDDTINIHSCDPYFIEICRRIRFSKDVQLICWRGTSEAYRVYPSPKDRNGISGDPWTPIDKDEGKTLTLSGAGFTYDKLRQIFLSGDYERPPALEFRDTDEGRLYLTARTLVRGQGKTEGLHHRIVPVPAPVTRWLKERGQRRQLAKRAQDRVELVAEVRTKVLYPSIGTLIGGGDTDAIDFDDVSPWLDAFDRAVDARFFENLWDSVEMTQGEALEQWQTVLREEAQTQFADAEDHAPSTSTRYWRARSSARSIFHGAVRRVLPHAVSDARTHAK